MTPFNLTAPQWLRVVLLGLVMAVVYLAITVGVDVWKAFRGVV